MSTPTDVTCGCGTALRAGHYASVLLSAVPAASTPVGETTDTPAPASVSAPVSAALIQAFATRLAASPAIDDVAVVATAVADVPQSLAVGIAALNAFLQVNVTGPVLADATAVNARLTKAWADAQTGDATTSLGQLHKACLRDLGVDGVSPYAYIPHLELFALARYILTHAFKGVAKDAVEIPSDEGVLKYSLAWTRLRIHVWHYKLLTQPSLSSGSNFTRSSQWSDVPTLAALILDSIDAVRSQVLAEEVWSTDADSWSREDKVQFLVEAANNYILLGRDDKARDALKEAAQTSGLVYSLSGALGKRTKFQEKSTSQLVVLAKSGVDAPAEDADDEQEAKPDALLLNNDTLLEEIHFAKEKQENEDPKTTLPPALKDLAPDDQPQLSPIDQIILLTEATLKDVFSPADTLTAEEVLPFAVRVIGDKSTNWQIYTQALLVRSRIEVHRSRTIERGVLQMQAVADQVMSDTTAEVHQEPKADDAGPGAPVIEISAPGETVSKPTSFLPAPKASESAPAHVRLQYIHALSSPPRWHLESELAYAWAGVGSLTSALEIFKRLRLWAEVALCLASSAATEDEDGRGSGGEAKAKGIVRWRLFQRATDSVADFDDDNIGEQVMYLKADDYTGPERDPPPSDAPRLLCILGDLENEPAHYERAWELSKHRFARAQRSLAEHYLQTKDLEKAHDAYTKATAVNRLSPDMWSRLGDISLRLGRALWSLYVEVTSQEKQQQAAKPEPLAVADDEEDDGINGSVAAKKGPLRDPATLLAQALAAYKKGASIAHSNWRIWDNVLTLAARMHPPAVAEMVLALRHIIIIRQSEDALDIDVLAALLQDVVLSKDKPAGDGIYEPPRGSHERLVARIIEEDVVPLITKRSELWALVSRLRGWRRDHVGAIEAAERAWRAAIGSAGSRLLPGAAATAADEARDWTADAGAWAVVVERTDALVSVLETWGPEVDTIGPKWKGKARLAVRSVMNKGRETWEGTDGWTVLEGLMENLKSS
ncbi:hypothetical protein EDB81DRAFT_678578 [Dactylonectria macrodidyma]|uniref:TPR repeat-containing protein n=1 Tax=Dactylonectria macrodidyma TaxID=307937 RepID=A0A9P9JHM9_9HYPO|nr:hypothetical protein EDB81DRAFT_678578 [Dactylonectria macrodidyma]